MKFLRSSLLKIALFTLIASLLLITYYPLTIDFNIYNPFWNGYEVLVKELNATVITRSFTLPKNPNGYVLILVPYVKPSIEVLSSIKDFVRRGGTLLLMDDYGFGNSVLEYLEAPVRFTGYPLIDPLFHYKSVKLPKIMGFMGILSGLREMYFNYATALNISSGVHVYALSSSFSFLDLNFNGAYDEGEPKGPFPVIVGFRYGNGRVIVVSDPSIGINVMIGLGDNLEFFRRICSSFKVIVDQTLIPSNIHFILKSMIMAFTTYILDQPFLSILIVAVIMGLAFSILRRGK